MFKSVPEQRRCCADGECSVSSRFRCSDRVRGCGPGDVQDPVAEVIELQRGKLAAPCATVGREPHEQEVLLGNMSALAIAGTADVVRDGFEELRFGSCEESSERVGFSGRRGLGRAGPRMVRMGWVSMIRSS